MTTTKRLTPDELRVIRQSVANGEAVLYDSIRLLEELDAVTRERDESEKIAAQWKREYDRAVRAMGGIG